jgi:hypothetical protein
MPDLIDPTVPAVYKALGALEAKAERSSADIEIIRDTLKGLPDRVEDIVKRATQPLTLNMDSVKHDLAEVQTTVNKWKAVLGVVLAASAVIGWGVANFITLKQLVVGH